MNALCIVSAAGGWIGMAFLVIAVSLAGGFEKRRSDQPQVVGVTVSPDSRRAEFAVAFFLFAGLASFASCSANERICEARDRAVSP